MKATSSWKRVPFGDVVPLAYTASFNELQLSRLKEGLVPKAMEDKWFIYYKNRICSCIEAGRANRYIESRLPLKAQGPEQ